MRLFYSLVALAALCLAGPANAQLLLEENFDYSVGSALTANGYTAHSGAGNAPVSVTADNLTFSGYPSVTGNAATVNSGSGSREDVNRAFTEQASGTVYTAFLARTDASTASGGYFFHLGPDPVGSTFRGRVYAQAVPGGVQYGVSSSTEAEAYASDVFALGATALVVLRYDVDSGQASIYTFAAGDDYSAEPGAADATGAAASPSSIGTFALRQHGSTQTVVVDGVRVGTSYSDVVPAASGGGDFTFDQPTAGQTFRVGAYLKPIWNSPTPSPATVRWSLRKGEGPYELIYQGPNLTRPDFGDARYLIPAGTPAGDDYQVRVADANDPSVFGESPRFEIADPEAAFTFPDIIRRQQFAFGSTQTVTWISPAGAPTDAEGGTVTLSLISKDNGGVVASVTTANDGQESFAIPETLNGYYYYSITSVDNPNYTGDSPKFKLEVAEVTQPMAGDELDLTTSLDIEWQTPTLTEEATVNLYLKGNGQSQALKIGTENDGFYAAENVNAPDGDGYTIFMTVVTTDGDRYSARSEPFSISSTPNTVVATRAPAPSHYERPAASVMRQAWLTAVVPDLADGSEVAAFAGDVLVGAGVVTAGQVAFAVTGEVGGVEVEDGAALSLRAFDGVERALPVGAVRDDVLGTEGLVFADGADFVVAMAGASAQAAPEAVTIDAAYPNPTRSRATVRFSTPTDGVATVEVLDLLGRRVATLVDGPVPAGTHEAVWSGDAAPGVYVVRLSADGVQQTARLTVIR